MKKKNGVFLGLLIAALLLLTMACPTAINPTPTAITFESAVQTGGTDGVADSTGLTLTFSVDPTSLTANNITVTGATKGALSGSGTTRSLAISDITVANGSLVFIEISSPSGFTIKGSPKAVVVYKDTRLDVTFESAVQTGGTSGTANSTGLTLTFSVDPTTLTADNITVTGATKGALSVSGTTRTLAISNITVGNGETVSVAIASPSGFTISGSPKTAVVYRASTVYAIGDTGPSGVGIVFYVTDGGLHGLEAAPSDQSTSQVWIEGGSTQITENGNTSTAIGTGLANSNAIIDQTGHTGSAAQVCRSYNGGGLTDWYLPSKDELNAIWTNLVDDGSGSNSGVGGFAEAAYWSSSECDSYAAWFQSFYVGAQYHFQKSYDFRVRAVRAF